MSTQTRIESRVGAVVLAAGSSSRMGEVKQLLPLADSSSVLERTLANLADSNVNEIVLVLGSSAEAIREHFTESRLKHLRILVNPDYGQGMATSLRVGLSVLDRSIEAALIVLADQPFVRAETFDRIINQYRRSDAPI